MKLRPLLEEFNQDQFYQSIKVHALYSIKISKQDQQASRVEPLHPKLSRILSRVKFKTFWATATASASDNAGLW